MELHKKQNTHNHFLRDFSSLNSLLYQNVYQFSNRTYSQWSALHNGIKLRLKDERSNFDDVTYHTIQNSLEEIEQIINLIQTNKNQNESYDLSKTVSVILVKVENLQNTFNQYASRKEQELTLMEVTIEKHFVFILALFLLFVVVIVASYLYWLTRPIHNLSNYVKTQNLDGFNNQYFISEIDNINQYIQTMIDTIEKDRHLKLALEEQITKAEVTESELKKVLLKLQNKQQQMMKLEKLSVIGTMMGGVAHELNNPLMGVQNYLEYLINMHPDKKSQKLLTRSLDETLRMQKLVKNMLIFSSNNTEIKLERVDLIVIIKSIVDSLQSEITQQNIALTLPTQESVIVYGNIDALKQIFINLFNNAIYAVQEVEEPIIKVAIEVKTMNRVLCSVINNGDIIPEKVKGNIFDPFFTTKSVGKGTGLGLSICQELSQKMGGDLRLDYSTEDVTVFSLKLTSFE